MNDTDDNSKSGRTVFDPTVLERLLGDVDEEGLDIMKRVVASYCSGKLHREIETGISAGDWELLERSAHNLKGLCYTLGTEVVASLAAGVEQAASESDMERCRELLPTLALELERAYSALAETRLYDAALVAELRAEVDAEH